MDLDAAAYAAQHPHRLLIDGDPSLFLKLASPDDSETLYRLIHENREHLGRYLHWARDIDFETTHASVQASVKKITEDGWLQYRIMVPRLGEDHKMIGTVTVFGRDVVNASALLSVWLAEEEIGKGYAMKACKRLLQYVFHAWNLRLVFMEIQPGNEHGESVARRLGAMPTDQYVTEQIGEETVQRRKWAILRA